MATANPLGKCAVHAKDGILADTTCLVLLCDDCQVAPEHASCEKHQLDDRPVKGLADFALALLYGQHSQNQLAPGGPGLVSTLSSANNYDNTRAVNGVKHASTLMVDTASELSILGDIIDSMKTKTDANYTRLKQILIQTIEQTFSERQKQTEEALAMLSTKVQGLVTERAKLTSQAAEATRAIGYPALVSYSQAKVNHQNEGKQEAGDVLDEVLMINEIVRAVDQRTSSQQIEQLLKSLSTMQNVLKEVNIPDSGLDIGKEDAREVVGVVRRMEEAVLGKLTVGEQMTKSAENKEAITSDGDILSQAARKCVDAMITTLHIDDTLTAVCSLAEGEGLVQYMRDARARRMEHEKAQEVKELALRLEKIEAERRAKQVAMEQKGGTDVDVAAITKVPIVAGSGSPGSNNVNASLVKLPSFSTSQLIYRASRPLQAFCVEMTNSYVTIGDDLGTVNVRCAWFSHGKNIRFFCSLATSCYYPH